MRTLSLGDAVVVRSTCAPPGAPPRSVETVWSGRVQAIAGPSITMSVRTGGGAEVVLQMRVSDIRERRTGHWEVELPMRHRLPSGGTA